MIVTPNRLAAAAGLCATAAGTLFIGIQIGHPHLDATSVQTTEVVVRDGLKVLMAVLALVGISGMYLSQVRRNGVLGLVGYLILAAGYLLMMSTTLIATVVLPEVAATDPGYVDGVLDVTTGRTGTADIGAMVAVNQVQGIAYLAGGLLFGIALFRARVLARLAAALLAVSGVVTLVLSLMPDAFYRLLAFPNGIAMIGLGLSLWLGQRRTTAAEAEAAPATVAAGR
ncbi:hypothetical protein [Nocardioides sp. GXQ0305]|uniref:hypothetical protein n=1 Tax=Nocardioides sp. GXQ0305 TaxID=3423912 RepID=UPI003D7C9DAF